LKSGSSQGNCWGAVHSSILIPPMSTEPRYYFVAAELPGTVDPALHMTIALLTEPTALTF